MTDTESREYPLRPIAAVGAIVRKGDAVLLIRRGKPPRLGEWSIPGGAVELGETWREATAREVREECGIEIAVEGDAQVIEIMQRDERGRIRYHYAIVDFAATFVSGDLKPASDVTEARWVNPQDLSGYPLNPQTREVLLRAIGQIGDEK